MCLKLVVSNINALIWLCHAAIPCKPMECFLEGIPCCGWKMDIDGSILSSAFEIATNKDIFMILSLEVGKEPTTCFLNHHSYWMVVIHLSLC